MNILQLQVLRDGDQWQVSDPLRGITGSGKTFLAACQAFEEKYRSMIQPGARLTDNSYRSPFHVDK